ncbi:Endonuclease G, mitochondrial [Orchesella cincta]|uniref:Endonuclease G, mitochondrial n=1 Tax=Orchesella cincta TaxID=48709 RepID=A0A1D2MFJ1_ORCCI|nr:Endonuclease G, mitochondrial [Orchesella cincta]
MQILFAITTQFLWNEDEEPKRGKTTRKRYHDKLFKEYCICDLFSLQRKQGAMRWRTENELVEGKGQFACAARKCENTERLRTWEVNFAYMEESVKKNALVKLRLCPDCSTKLNYSQQRREVMKKHKKAEVILPNGISRHKRRLKQEAVDEVTSLEAGTSRQQQSRNRNWISGGRCQVSRKHLERTSHSSRVEVEGRRVRRNYAQVNAGGSFSGYDAGGGAVIPMDQEPHVPKVKPTRASQIMKFGFPGMDNIRSYNDFVLSYDQRNRVPHWVFEHLTRNHRLIILTIKGVAMTEVGKGFNRDAWNTLEKYVRGLTRRYENVYVCSGPLYLPEADGKYYVRYEVIGQNNVAVPTHFFKVVVCEEVTGQLDLEAYCMPNKVIDDNIPVTSYRVPLETIEERGWTYIL